MTSFILAYFGAMFISSAVLVEYLEKTGVWSAGVGMLVGVITVIAVVLFIKFL